MIKYAPVIIATLNRREHLKRCLDSLNENTGATETEVFVSVDYPPNSKYEKGYNEVVEFLKSSNYKFKKFNVFFQEENLGPSANFDFLRNIVKKEYSTYIFTEDDNEFSLNFLQYINLGLELYESDEKVMAICGYKDADWEYDENNVAKSKLFPAYGYGAWFEKDEKYRREVHKVLLDKYTMKISNVMRLYKKNKCLFCQYISQIICTDEGLFWENGELSWCDSVKSIYMHFTDKSVIVPLESKSRTWGNDGSGVNMPDTTKGNTCKILKIDEKKQFDFKIVKTLEFNEKNYLVGNEYLNQCINIKAIVCSWIRCFVFVLLNYNRDKMLKIADRLRL